MKEKTGNKEKLAMNTIFAFFVTLSIFTIIASIVVWNIVNVEKLKTDQLIAQKAMQITAVISKLLYKTNMISALVIQNDGHVEDFDKVANTIIDDPAILNVIIAPNGVVSEVFPLAGNEALIGLNYFEDGIGNREAVMAKELEELVFGGPIDIVQGGQALVGILPVFLDNSDADKEFWGLISVTLKHPQALDGAGLDLLRTQELAFELWRTNPDNDEKQIIAYSGYDYDKNARYIEQKITISNADWFFRILPTRAWHDHLQTWVVVCIGLFASFMAAFIVQNNHRLKLLKEQLEIMAYEDSLTGIYNRRFFMELATKEFERICRVGVGGFVIIFDLDNFKNINDNYGHSAGDKVLVSVVNRIKKIKRPYDLYARYGGEEFIIMIPDICEEDVKDLVERFRLSVCEKPVDYKGICIPVSASFGMVGISNSYNFETTINLADEALYNAKKEGRNRVVLIHTTEINKS